MLHADDRQPFFATLYWAIGLVGMLVAIVWMSTPLDLRPVETQIERTQATGFLYGNERFSQIVQVPHDGLAAIQFWLLAHQRDGGGKVILHVATPTDPDHDLAMATVPLSDFPPQPPVAFRLPLFDQITTPVLLFTLEAPDLDRVHAVSVLGSGNRYGGGMLLINGKPRPAEDLAFRLLALRTQGDQFFPLAHLTLGRSGIFGQAWLYIALLWAMLWAYGWVVITIVRWAIRHQRTANTTSTPV